jgi:hypothetical protein
VAAVLLSTRNSGSGHSAATVPPPAAASALGKAAKAAAAGPAAPVLRSGQAWHTVSVMVQTATHTFQRSTVEVDKWIGADGMEGEQGQTGARGAGFSGVGTPSSPPGFGDWDPSPHDGHGPVQDFPTSAAAVPAYLKRQFSGYWHYVRDNRTVNDLDHSPFTQLAELTAFLGDWPLRPAARAAAFEAIAHLPGLRYLGPSQDLLRHRGVAVAEDGVGIPAFQLRGDHPPRQDYRFTLILDPATGRVLGSTTTLLSQLPLAGGHPGQTLFASAYQPGLPQAGEVTPPTPAMKQQAARAQAIENLRKPGHPCYRQKSLLSGPNAGSAAAIACRNAMQRIIRTFRPTH